MSESCSYSMPMRRGEYNCGPTLTGPHRHVSACPFAAGRRVVSADFLARIGRGSFGRILPLCCAGSAHAMVLPGWRACHSGVSTASFHDAWCGACGYDAEVQASMPSRERDREQRALIGAQEAEGTAPRPHGPARDLCPRMSMGARYVSMGRLEHSSVNGFSARMVISFARNVTWG